MSRLHVWTRLESVSLLTKGVFQSWAGHSQSEYLAREPIVFRLKKIIPMSQSCRARLFFGALLIQQNSRFEFFLLAYFFFQFFWTCLSKYTRKDMSDTMKHFEQQTSSTLCSVLYLVHPKSSSIFQSCDRLKSDTSAAKKTKNKQTNKKTIKKTHLGQIFQSVTSFET